VPVGVAPAQNAEQALQESRQRYEALFGQMLEGVAYCQLLFDEAGQPADWIYLEVNPAFEALTGLRDAAGKRVTEVIPGVRETNPELLEIFGRVAQTGVPEQFETYLPALERWFSVKVYRPQAAHVAAIFENITERKRAAELVQTARDHLEEAQRLAHLGSWDLDLASDKISGSAEFFRLFDAVPEEILRYAQFAERLHPDDRERVDRDVAEALAANRTYDTEYRVRLRDGGWRDINALGHVVADADGKPLRFVGTCLDITEHKRADEELRVSQARYKTIVDNIPQKVYVKGPDLRWASVNGLLARDFGLRPEDVVGKTNRELFPQDLADKYSADDQRIIEAGATEEFDEEYLDQGERRMVHSIKTPVRDDSGTIQGVLGVFWDVTDERRAQDELRASNERLRRLVDSSVFGFTVSRADGSILEANDYFLDLVGHTREELERGEIDWRTITPVEWLPADERGLAEALEGGTCAPYEKEYLRPDGSRISVLLAYAYLSDSEDRAVFVLDISERKRAESQLKRALKDLAAVNAELEDRVKARTAALEAANRELEAFSYSVSHDLRAPLRSVDGFSKILLQDHGEQLDAEAQRVLGVVIRNVGQMGRLIDDLLAFSRVSRKELERQPVDIDRLARSVSEELRAAEPERAIEVDIGPLGGTLGDSGLLRQVWVNLLGNAFKFTRPAERPRIEIRCEQGAGERRYSVTDNGVGFDAAYVDKLFQPFQRLHSTSEFEGTGIGLAIVARIVQRHGGRVWAEGASGQGATFGFSLPTGKEKT
jgi:PAS domain S-box-containing protein